MLYAQHHLRGSAFFLMKERISYAMTNKWVVFTFTPSSSAIARAQIRARKDQNIYIKKYI